MHEPGRQTEQCLEREEQALRQRTELLKLQTDIAIAEAEAKVHEADEAKQSDVKKRQRLHDLSERGRH